MKESNMEDEWNGSDVRKTEVMEENPIVVPFRPTTNPVKNDQVARLAPSRLNGADEQLQTFLHRTAGLQAPLRSVSVSDEGPSNAHRHGVTSRTT
jgi:hypothetical protein